ncbi:MAG: RidA family protein, partial [Candidatus Nanopelagicales bacterium]
MSTVETRIAELGLTLPPVAAPIASYVPAVRTGNLVFTSGQLPLVAGQLVATGKVGADVDVDTAKAAARICALNALAA